MVYQYYKQMEERWNCGTGYHTLTELDIEVDKLRSYLRLSANPELKYLSVDKYGNWAAMVDEIGRMVGGWIQSVSK